MIDNLKQYHLFYMDDSNIINNGTRDGLTLEQLRADFADQNWAIIPVGEVPESWQDMTIIDGALVLAAAEVIAAREVVRGVAATEAVRQARAARFTAESDQLMFDAIEAFAAAHPEEPAFTAWLTAKALIRTQHPKTPTEDVL